jgi:hypothetical protein
MFVDRRNRFTTFPRLLKGQLEFRSKLYRQTPLSTKLTNASLGVAWLLSNHLFATLAALVTRQLHTVRLKNRWLAEPLMCVHDQRS